MKSILSVLSICAMLALPVAAQRGQCDGTGPHGQGRGQCQNCQNCEKGQKCDRQGAQRGMRGGMRGGMGGMRQSQTPPAAQEKK